MQVSKQWQEIKRSPLNYSDYNKIPSVLFSSFEYYQQGESILLYLSNENLTQYNQVEIPQQLQKLAQQIKAGIYVLSAQTEYLENNDQISLMEGIQNFVRQIRQIHDANFFGIVGSDMYGLIAAVMAQNYVYTVDFAISLQGQNICNFNDSYLSLKAYTDKSQCQLVLNNQFDQDLITRIKLGCVISIENPQICQQYNCSTTDTPIYTEEDSQQLFSDKTEVKSNLQIFKSFVPQKYLQECEIETTGLISGITQELIDKIQEFKQLKQNLNQQ